MGCCISKCKPKKKASLQEFNHVVQDKLVIISEAGPKASKIPPSSSNKIPPPSPTTSTSSSISSFTCTNSNSSYSTLSGGSSCISSSKDRSFSNEFLRSCIKENPHVIRINSIKECSQLLLASPSNVHAKRLNSPAKIVVAPPKYSIQQGAAAGCVRQKRVRSNSPTGLHRQKSFRGDSERYDASSYSLPSRALRSPSPSRRFNGDNGRVISSFSRKECGNYSKRMINNVASNSASTCVSSSLTKENWKAVMSPYINQTHLLKPKCMMRNTETCIHRISSKIDEIAVDEALARQESECLPLEDVENPHISLDCFIFL